MKVAIKFSKEGIYQSHCTDTAIADLNQVVPNNEGFEFYEITQEQLTDIYYLKLINGEIIIDKEAKQSDIDKATTAKKYAENKLRLNKLNEYLLQAMAGESVPNITERKDEFFAIHNELRVLEGKLPRILNNEII